MSAGEAEAGLRWRFVGALVKVHSLPRALQPTQGSPCWGRMQMCFVLRPEMGGIGKVGGGQFVVSSGGHGELGEAYTLNPIHLQASHGLSFLDLRSRPPSLGASGRFISPRTWLGGQRRGRGPQELDRSRADSLAASAH